jgi:hypothetical protein
MKKVLFSFLAFGLFGCAELQQIANQYPTLQTMGDTEIASGLKEALNNGITKEVAKLTATDGFFKNQAVKILLPAELQKVDKGLRSIGLGSLADEGIKLLNRAAEDAVKEAAPIFVDAVRNMTVMDARTILMGNDNSATLFLQNSTTTALYGKFNPVIQKSLSKVGADAAWKNLITKYNAIPLTANVNPDLNDYVTQKTLEGVFKMIAVEEKDIRNNLNARTSDLLKKVFAIQDNK